MGSHHCWVAVLVTVDEKILLWLTGKNCFKQNGVTFYLVTALPPIGLMATQ